MKNKMTLKQAYEHLKYSKVFVETPQKFNLITNKLKELGFDEGETDASKPFIICERDSFYSLHNLIIFNFSGNKLLKADDILNIEIRETKFKIGDAVKFKLSDGKETVGQIFNILTGTSKYDIYYTLNGNGSYTCRGEEDIKSYNPFQFNPFDKVLVRENDNDVWTCDLFSHIDISEGKIDYITTGGCRHYQCIPFQGNKELIGTNNKSEC